MKTDDILNNIPTRETVGISKKYGIFGLTLGEDLKARLDEYCNKHNIAKSQLIKALLIRYLNKEENEKQNNESNE